MQGATYHPIVHTGTIRLRRRSSCSWDCCNVPALVDWLQERGYRPIPTRSGLEYARMQQGGALVVIYQSGSVVCQGENARAAVQLLQPLLVEQATVVQARLEVDDE